MTYIYTKSRKQAVPLNIFVILCYTTFYKINFPKTILQAVLLICKKTVLLNSLATHCNSQCYKLFFPQTVLLIYKKRYY